MCLNIRSRLRPPDFGTPGYEDIVFQTGVGYKGVVVFQTGERCIRQGVGLCSNKGEGGRIVCAKAGLFFGRAMTQLQI